MSRARERTYINLTKKYLLDHKWVERAEDVQDCTVQYRAGKFFVKRDLFGADLVARCDSWTWWINSCVGKVAEHKRRFDKWPPSRRSSNVIFDWTPGKGGRPATVRIHETIAGGWSEICPNKEVL